MPDIRLIFISAFAESLLRDAATQKQVFLEGVQIAPWTPSTLNSSEKKSAVPYESKFEKFSPCSRQD